MSLATTLRYHLSNLGTSAYSDAQLTQHCKEAVVMVNKITGQSQTFADLDALPDPTAYSTLVIIFAQLLVVKTQIAKLGAAKKYQTQDTIVDPGDEGSRLEKAMRRLWDEFKELGHMTYGIRPGFAGGVQIDVQADIADADFVVTG